ncbi:MAG: tRNA preQ1(34) S-adenosylmethionine ribosyltransferase-isomerase QueA [Pirellulales bacterium]|nr:tRNA preQ1(34) S-adenosylmethionine ribosyltransferase-isomerase QueA [Pirellulales bacterium]
MSLSDYDFNLPEELIAQQPLPHRADSRMLVANRARRTCEHAHTRDLPSKLRSGDCLVLNDSRVVPARLVGSREKTGGAWEGLFLHAQPDGDWVLICKTRGRLTVGETILVNGPMGGSLRLALLHKGENGKWIARAEQPGDYLPLLEQVGRIPLPQYIRRGEMTPEDIARYQTVYATQPGSVAAPTAGLHLTEQVLRKIVDRGVTIARVTLHVGLGTFRPIQAENLEDHVMHSEWYSLTEESAAAINATRAGSGRVIAVGTTSVRVLESVAAKSPDGELHATEGETNLFIRPGFEFKVIGGLLTNFHLPFSTLLVLVRTFGGHELIRQAYQQAINERYRFFSYGDAMLIE